MRVIHVITRLSIGGAQENTVATVLSLREQYGVDASLVTGPSTGTEGSLQETYRASGGPLIFLNHLVRPISPLLDLQTKRKLTCLFRKTTPDIVHTHSGKAGFLGRLAARDAGVPVIIHSIHGPSFGPFQGTLTNIAFRFAERIAGRVTTHFISVADAMTNRYLKAGIGQRNQYSLIRSGFDVQAFAQAKPDSSLQSRLGLKSGDFVIGMIARLFKLKGHDELLEAAPHIIAKFPNAKFLLVGGGSQHEQLEQMAKQLGISNRIVFTGLVKPDEVPRYTALMDVLAHLSRREGLARALAQALAAGRPVIAWDCDGAEEICRNGETGILLQTGDTDGLINAVVRLATNSALRKELGTTGRDWVQKHFTVKSMVTAQHELYERLLTAGR